MIYTLSNYKFLYVALAFHLVNLISGEKHLLRKTKLVLKRSKLSFSFIFFFFCVGKKIIFLLKELNF